MRTTKVELNPQEPHVARTSRLRRFILMAGLAWFYFAAESYNSGYANNAMICAATGMASSALCLLPFEKSRRRAIVASNMYLAICLIGLTCMSVVTGQSASYSHLFLCCFGLGAAHLIGIRASLIWSTISCAVIILIGLDVFGTASIRVHTNADKIQHIVGVCVLIFLLNWQAQHYFQVQNDQLTRISGTLKEKAKALEKLADFDTLTGLFNRHSFHRQIRNSVLHASETQTRFALLLLDLDGFKEVNDTQGHQTGDEILKHVAQRLREEIKEDHLVARLGGDEFTVIIEQAESEAAITAIGNRIKERLAMPYRLKGKQFLLDASIGASIFPTHSESIQELLSFADTAMYRAKVTDSGTQVYDTNMTTELVERHELERRLLKARKSEEFQLFYQPQLNLRTNRIIGCEALLRWNNDGQWIPPNKFIGSLESTREICIVGKWILNEACRSAQGWHAMGYPINVSVNVSPIQFRDAEFIESVLDAIEQSQLPPEYLDLEVTESVLISDIDSTENKLATLRELGVSVSIDDFGTGYSSLVYLKRLPLTRLKIDREFIKDYPDNDEGMIVETIVNLSKNMNLKVLAEGVEAAEQLEFLREIGCDEYQGFVFSKPRPQNEFVSLLEKQPAVLTAAMC